MIPTTVHSHAWKMLKSIVMRLIMRTNVLKGCIIVTAISKPSVRKKKKSQPSGDDLQELSGKLDKETKFVHVKGRYGSLIKILVLDILRATDAESMYP